LLSPEPFIKNFFKTQDIRFKGPINSIRPEEVALGGMPTVCLGQIKNPNCMCAGKTGKDYRTKVP